MNENSTSAGSSGRPHATTSVVEEHRTETTIQIPTPPKLAYLSVQLLFCEEPLEDIEVRFARIGTDSHPDGEMGTLKRTDNQGIAQLEFPVPTENYFCLIENQPPVIISTVEDKTKPLALVLPIGRPYFES